MSDATTVQTQVEVASDEETAALQNFINAEHYVQQRVQALESQLEQIKQQQTQLEGQLQQERTLQLSASTGRQLYGRYLRERYGLQEGEGIRFDGRVLRGAGTVVPFARVQPAE